jgi:transposase
MSHANRPAPEFRRDAIRLALTSGRMAKDLADDVGAGLSPLIWWASRHRGAAGRPEVHDDLVAELKRLRRENTVLEQVRDIVKKPRPAAPFSRLFNALSGNGRGCLHRREVSVPQREREGEREREGRQSARSSMPARPVFQFPRCVMRSVSARGGSIPGGAAWQAADSGPISTPPSPAPRQLWRPATAPGPD